MAYRVRTRDEHFQDSGPKRILALDGGGLRGIVTLGYLAEIERILRERVGGDPGFRLAHYFDLVAGTSTGAIIAAALAKGLTVEAITQYYLQMGTDVFRDPKWYDPRRFVRGVLVPKYNERELGRLLREVFGDGVTLGSPDLGTGLLVVTKRVDTGSPWPLDNNPRGKYFTAGAGGKRLGNADYPLWQVVRASTAAPAYFESEEIVIGVGPAAQKGRFVDGGVSPFNNPALQAFMFATLGGYRVGWRTGPDDLLVVSVGTGRGGPEIEDSRIVAKDAVLALAGLMDDCADLVETLMQWMSDGPCARKIDSVLGTLSGDLLGGTPQFRYLRYNVVLTSPELAEIGVDCGSEEIESLAKMDRKENLDRLREVGLVAAGAHVKPEHFAAQFDLS
jgi:predicted acylesterase/phospholipase RssA